ADDAGDVRVVLALPSWDDYLRTGLDDLIESAAQSPIVLLRAQTLLTTLLNAAPPARQPPITRRLQRAGQLGAGNFPLIWHDATGTAAGPARRPFSNPLLPSRHDSPPATCAWWLLVPGTGAQESSHPLAAPGRVPGSSCYHPLRT